MPESQAEAKQGPVQANPHATTTADLTCPRATVRLKRLTSAAAEERLEKSSKPYPNPTQIPAAWLKIFHSPSRRTADVTSLGLLRGGTLSVQCRHTLSCISLGQTSIPLWSNQHSCSVALAVMQHERLVRKCMARLATAKLPPQAGTAM
eukprot:1142261-Pelagomonas_calceolata.AAC.12